MYMQGTYGNTYRDDSSTVTGGDVGDITAVPTYNNEESASTTQH